MYPDIRYIKKSMFGEDLLQRSLTIGGPQDLNSQNNKLGHETIEDEPTQLANVCFDLG